MPIMDGFELVRKLKTDMKHSKLPRGLCIANTGFVDLDTKLRCVQEGMDFYLSKPIKIKDLEDYMSSVFR